MSPQKTPTLGQGSKENDRHGSEGAISQVFHQKEDFLSHIFLVGKKDGGNKPVINLKNLNNFSYQHFKIEGLYCLNKSFYWQEGELYVEDQFERCLFLCATKQRSSEINEIPEVSASALDQAQHQSFQQIIKGTNISAETFDGLGGNKNLGRSPKGILTGRDSAIYLLRHLDFVINFKKCMLMSTQKITFLGMTVNSKTMTLPLPHKNVQNLKNQCLELYQAQEKTLLKLTRQLRSLTLTSTIQATLPVLLQF